MNPSTDPQRVSPPWLLIIGLLLGGSLIAFVVWDSRSNKGKGIGRSKFVVHVTNDTWQQDVIQSKLPVLVDFSADWCGPCQLLAPTIDNLADRYQGKIKVAKFDVGPNFTNGQKLMQEYGINGIPHVILFKDGEPRKVFGEREMHEAAFVAAIEKLLKS